VILNNSIIFNEARYGAGIVLNYTGCVILNNIIASNTGGQNYYGGSGIWIYGNLVGTSKYIINNTIVNNTSTLVSGTGGISVWSAANVIIKNNIIFYNVPDLQIKATSAAPLVSYSDVMGGYDGNGNLDVHPVFDPASYYLDESSLCVDAGDTTFIFNDLEDADSPGTALFPSLGTLRNDMGAYGGPYASVIPFTETLTGINDVDPVMEKEIWVYPNPSAGLFTIKGEGEAFIYNTSGHLVYSSIVNNTEIDLRNMPEGLYLLKMKAGERIFTGKIIIEK
jgi:hypothetical protein